MSFQKDFKAYSKKTVKVNQQYSALLGKTEKVVEHPDRKGYCYARLVDNLSELIVVFNDKVSQKFDLPVIVERRGNTWYVVGRDTERYTNYGSNSSFLPKHAGQHSFNRDARGGADTVFIYPDQFMPLLVYPSGTYGAGNLLIAPYMLQRANDFVYVGNTGTPNLLVYKPTDNQAIMGLVYLDKVTGNPGLLIASGTPMPGSYTGTSQIVPYLPFPSSNQEPLYFFRLVSGTSNVGWNNLYNARQFIGGSTSTGTSGGSTNPGGSDTQVQYNNGGVFGGHSSFYFDDILGNVYLGGTGGWGNFPTETSSNHVLSLLAISANQPVVMRGKTWGNNVADYTQQRGYRSRGTRTSPTTVSSGDRLIGMQGMGYDGYNYGNPGGASQGLVVVETTEAFTTGSHGTGIAFEGTHRGTISRQRIGFIDELGMNIATGTFNIGDSPHTHTYSAITSKRIFLPFGSYATILPVTTSPARPYAVTMDRAMTLVSWSQHLYVVTTNNGSNYWSIEMQRASDNAVLNTITTASLSPNTHNLITDTTFANQPLAASNKGLVLVCTKVGTPGDLYAFCPLVEAEL